MAPSPWKAIGASEPAGTRGVGTLLPWKKLSSKLEERAAQDGAITSTVAGEAMLCRVVHRPRTPLREAPASASEFADTATG